jgi:hypothetical protein
MIKTKLQIEWDKETTWWSKWSYSLNGTNRQRNDWKGVAGWTRQRDNMMIKTKLLIERDKEIT